MIDWLAHALSDLISLAPNSGMTHDPAKLAAYRASETSRKEAHLAAFRNQPHAKVIVIPNVTHYIFLSDEA